MIYYNLKDNYADIISRPVVRLFLNNYCEPCLRKKKRVSQQRGVVVKPMIFNEVNVRGQVDLIGTFSESDPPK